MGDMIAVFSQTGVGDYLSDFGSVGAAAALLALAFRSFVFGDRGVRSLYEQSRSEALAAKAAEEACSARVAALEARISKLEAQLVLAKHGVFDAEWGEV